MGRARNVGSEPAVGAISPCVHPGCRDEDGNPRLTAQNMCDPCRTRFRRELAWIVMDYVSLKACLPSPVRGGGQVRHTARLSFGHPAEDASFACAEIAGELNNIEAKLRAHLCDSPAPDPARVAEPRLVSHAYAYLRAHLEQLCDWPDVGHHAAAIHDTHQTNRYKYGFGREVNRLPMPCPSCDVAMLVREVGRITCENCGRVVREEEYPMLTRIAVDWAIADYEAELAAAAADCELKP